MLRSFTALLSLASAAMAVPTPAANRQLLVSGLYQIQTVNFDEASSKLSVTSTTNLGKDQIVPSWMLPGDKSLYGVSEYASGGNVYSIDSSSGKVTKKSDVEGSTGLVHLAYNADQTRVVGAGYGSGMIDIFDSSNGGLTKLQSLDTSKTDGKPKDQHNPHQAVLDPTGQFFVVPDLGGGQLHVLSESEGTYKIASSFLVGNGTDGPRHGVFVNAANSTDGQASHFLVATELTNKVLVYSVEYAEDTLNFRLAQTPSESFSWGPTAPETPKEAAAAEIVIASNMRDVYVSNRITGNADGDFISHFRFSPSAAKPLKHVANYATAGTYPRMMSLSADGKYLYSILQGGLEGETADEMSGLIVYGRCSKSGELTAEPIDRLAMNELAHAEADPTTPGPLFVQEL